MASQVEAIKWVPGTKFLVDGFRFQAPDCRAYFLTHAHSDHTTGLSKSFNAGPTYCSPITARVLRHDFGLRPDCLRLLELDETVSIAGVEVTPMDANHCPGAVMFLFKVPPSSPGGRAQVILHTGDMRWQPGMAQHPALQAQQVDTVLLDTTYCTPRWSFPPQSEVVSAMAEFMAAEAAAEPATLFVVGSYHIGKERAYLGAAAALGWRVHCTPAKHKLLRLLGLPAEWLALLTDQSEEAQIHVLSMGEQLHEQALADRIEGTAWKRAVALKPTGWTWRQKGGLDVRDLGAVKLVGVPYSEHSSFTELRDCVRALRPRRIIPTVNAGDPASSRAQVDRFADLMDLSKDRSRLSYYLLRGQQAQQAQQVEGAQTPQAMPEDGAQDAGQQQQQPDAGCSMGAGALSNCSQPGQSGGSAAEPSSTAWAAQAAPWQEPDPAAASPEHSGAGGSGAGGSQHAAPEQQQQVPHQGRQEQLVQQQQHAQQPQQKHQGQHAQQQQQAEDADVDLAAIDVREQQRILAMIQAGRQTGGGGSSAAAAKRTGRGSKQRGTPSNGSSSSRGGGRGSKRAAPSSSSGSALKQRSLRGFLSPAGSSPPADRSS